jgi:hypothetical protein
VWTQSLILIRDTVVISKRHSSISLRLLRKLCGFLSRLKAVASRLLLGADRATVSDEMVSETVKDLPLGFLLHVLIEVPASINFFVFPSGQLGSYSPQAHAIIRQYALLLITTIVISIIFIVRPLDDLSGQVAGALGLYHIGPSLRSIGRLWTRSQQGHSLIPSEAAFYLLLHTVAGAALAHCCWSAFWSRSSN